jgi:hypothetical protein
MIFKSDTSRSDLESVKVQFDAWRSNKKNERERIPKELWEAAIEIVGPYSINEVATHLRLNYTDLKKRMPGNSCQSSLKLNPSAFMEIPCDPPNMQSECIIEMEDDKGCRMKMSFRGETRLDLMELGKAFWNKR